MSPEVSFQGPRTLPDVPRAAAARFDATGPVREADHPRGAPRPDESSLEGASDEPSICGQKCSEASSGAAAAWGGECSMSTAPLTNETACVGLCADACLWWGAIRM